MADPEHVKFLEQGVEIWNRWRAENPNVKPLLIDADLINAELPLINFFEVDLRKANLKKVNIRGADLS